MEPVLDMMMRIDFANENLPRARPGLVRALRGMMVSHRRA
jgi:hypothetical protein